MIRAGAYKLGDKLASERMLAEEFGVDRSSMREALSALEARGLVSIAQGVGAYVTERPTDRGEAIPSLLVLEECTVPELVEVRLALECPAAALAAKRIAPSEAAKLDEILASSNDPSLSDAEYIEKDAELHMTIFLATRNTLLIRVYESIRHAFIEYSAHVIQLPGRRATAQRGHAEIVEAIVKRQAHAAQQAMSAHLEAAESDIVEYLDAASREDQT